jgi:hypothetical protein
VSGGAVVQNDPKATATNYKAAANAAAGYVRQFLNEIATNSTYGHDIYPSYVLLDPEGDSAPQFSSGDAYMAEAMAQGWMEGMSGFVSNAAVYIPSQAAWKAWSPASWTNGSSPIPVFAGLDIPPSSSYPFPTGSNIVGYMAAGGVCTSSVSQVTTIDGWGGNINTIQFPGTTWDCTA